MGVCSRASIRAGCVVVSVSVFRTGFPATTTSTAAVGSLADFGCATAVAQPATRSSSFDPKATARFGIWNLGLGNCLVIGAWSLVIRRSCSFRRGRKVAAFRIVGVERRRFLGDSFLQQRENARQHKQSSQGRGRETANNRATER